MTNAQNTRIESIRTFLKSFPQNPSMLHIQAIERGFNWIWNRQLQDEQAIGVTDHENGVGFNKPDAMKAKWHHQALFNYGRFNAKRACTVARMLVKYARQLSEMPVPN